MILERLKEIEIMFFPMRGRLIKTFIVHNQSINQSINQSSLRLLKKKNPF